MLFNADNIHPREYSPLALAYIGDTVYDLFIRTKVIAKGNRHLTEMHKESVSFVKAHSQSVSAYALENELTEDELRVLKWGRNAKSNTTPKNADVTEYRMATGFETLVGYLYLLGEDERLSYLLEIAYNAVVNEEK